MARPSKQAIWISLALVAALLKAPGALAVTCVADCDGDGAVTVSELVTAVGIFTGDLGGSKCFRADADADGSVTIEDLVAGVRALIDGCTRECGNAFLDGDEDCDGTMFADVDIVAWVFTTNLTCTDECQICTNSEGCVFRPCCDARQSCVDTGFHDDPGSCTDCTQTPLSCRCASTPNDQICQILAQNAHCFRDATLPGCEPICTYAAAEGQPCATPP